LAANGQANTMTNTTVTLDVAQAADVLLNLTTQRTFNGVIPFKNRRDSTDFFVAQVASPLVLINARFVAQITRCLVTDPVQVSQ
jgi:hypothetical protein